MSIRLTFLCALLVTLPIAVSSGGIPRVPLGHDEIRYLNSIPKDNPLTRTKIALGKLLFFDKRLSRDGSIACGSCHQPHRAFTDGRVLPTGIDGQTPKRNAPTLINRAYGTAYFYDGRAASLEEQALIPIQSPSEMGNTLEQVVATLSVISGYHAHFKAAFGDSTITPDRIAKALAAFERTLISGESPYDLFEYGGPKGTMSKSAIRGLRLFRTKARCTLCHMGFNYTDEDFHNIGTGWDRADLSTYEKTGNLKDIKGIDPGRYAQTQKPEHFGAMKTPTLREVARTAPYMHNGSIKTLQEIIEFYDKGGTPNPFLDELITPLNLTDAEKQDLIAFLKALNGINWLHIEPPFKFPK